MSDATDRMDRLALFEKLALSEMFVPLTEEAAQDTVSPRTFETSEGEFALAFFTVEGLSDFCGEVEFVAMPGRALSGLLASADVGLCVEPAGDAALLGVADLNWLISSLATKPVVGIASGTDLTGPATVSRQTQAALNARVQTVSGLAKSLVLARGGQGRLLIILDPEEGAEATLASTFQEALLFSDAGADWSVGFAQSDSPLGQRLIETGTLIEIPEPKAVSPATPVAPGSDPDKPPILH